MPLPFPVPDSLSPAFTLSHCTAADTDAMIEVYYDGFSMDRRNTFWWSPDKPAMFRWMKRRIRRRMDDHTKRHFKVTDVQSGDLVAFARWEIPEGHAAAFGEWIDATPADVSQTVTADEGGGDLPVTSAPAEAVTPPTTDYPEGAKPELCNVLFHTLKDMSEQQGAETMLGLSLLCTSTKYYRRGAAKALMLPMLAIADAHGLKTYLEATPQGKPIYEKLGFREVDELTFDLEKLTGSSDGIYKISIMVREPRSI
ncbi:acyl-CoA N-acyltransferase [Hypoxylon cercidicola]|nr:acyl-CoA N-acyltransferase [Hypoxylon cercidicola]